MLEKSSMDIADIATKVGPTKRGHDLSQHLLDEFQCPSCQIERKTRILLVPVPHASSDGILRCYYCGKDFPAPDRK
jgi:hypothetical protein